MSSLPPTLQCSRVSEVLDTTGRAYGDQPAMRHKHDGLWQVTTWREYREQARLTARGLMHLGLQPGGGVAIIGNNCPQWFIADIGAILAGGVPAGIYTTSSAEQCQYITDHCDATVAVVDDPKQLVKFKEQWPTMPKLQHIILMHGSDADERVHSWDELRRLAEKVPETELDARIAQQKPEDACTLIYTSGTTGNPKGVLITHDNLTWTARQVLSSVDIRVGDQGISYLPLSHIAEQVVSLHGPMFLGGCTWFAESLDKLGDNLREVRPHYFLGVPRVWEKIQAKMMAAGATSSPLKQKIAKWARGVGATGGLALQHNLDPGFEYRLAQKLVFNKVRLALGLDRCRVQITSAAPIGRGTLEFFLSLGVILHEVYGMSECTGPATISNHSRWATGKAGFAMPGCDVKIAADGEILVRGRNVCKGYFKNADATAETIDAQGWLHTGDVGEFDDKQMLQITDRKKDLLITAGGENVAPQVLEGMLKGISVIGQAVVIGDGRKYLAALLTLDPERVAAEAKLADSPATDAASAATCAKFRGHLQGQIDTLNGRLAQVQTIKRWIVLPQELSIEGGELTPTMKIKRKVVREKYSEQIEALYA